MRSGRGSSLFALGAQIGDDGKVDESLPIFAVAIAAFAAAGDEDAVANGSGTSYFALRLCAGLYRLLLALCWW